MHVTQHVNWSWKVVPLFMPSMVQLVLRALTHPNTGTIFRNRKMGANEFYSLLLLPAGIFSTSITLVWPGRHRSESLSVLKVH